VVDKQKAKELARKLHKNEFTLEDFLDQIGQIKKMGNLQELINMIPGVSKLKQLKDAPKPDERELFKTEAIIRSMTIQERRNYRIISASRRVRIANGSGTTVNDVNRVLKSYTAMLKMMKKMRGKVVTVGGKRRKLPKGLGH
jgi:signal recognition particle subunit SRP54